jgi:hypothetical protein
MKLFVLFIFLVLHSLHGAEFIVQEQNSSKKPSTWIALPYLFSSDSMGFTVGAVGIFNGFIQPQMTIVATGFVGQEQDVEKVQNESSVINDTSRASGALLSVSGFRPSFSKRMFMSFMGSYAYFPKQKLYVNGAHDSKQELDSEDPNTLTPLQTQGFNNWLKMDMRYVLPWGEGKETVLPIIEMKRGVVVNRLDKGGGMPFVTGQSIIGTELFYTRWTADKLLEEPSYNTNGMRLFFIHDNTDYPDNPSRGYNTKLQFSFDAGRGNSTQRWSAIEVGYSHYFALPDHIWTRQNVIALNFWSAYSPSWDQSKKRNPDHPDAVLDRYQTPMWEGARLGGWSRMRAYDSNRFNDKAALYGALEYRVIPDFNPMRDQKWSPIPIDWFQAVFFAEAGRVAPHYHLRTLLDDMKYDVGFSLRALAAKIPVRFDLAVGDEGSNMWVMIKHPF